MRFPHPIRARRERRMTETVKMAQILGGHLEQALTRARPKIEYTVRHAPRPKPDQIEIKGYLRDGQPVYLDAIAFAGQRIAIIPMRDWLVSGDNPLDRLEIVFNYYTSLAAHIRRVTEAGALHMCV